MTGRLRWYAAAAALAVAVAARADESAASGDTAFTLPRGGLEVGVFAPLRWGLTDHVELSVHPLVALVAPHLDAKIAWGRVAGIAIASTHGVLYPTPAMRLLSKEGTGGIVPHDVRYPHLLETGHHLVATRALGDHLLTVRAGGRLAWNLTEFDGPRTWSEVEWHFIWPRAAAWFTGWSLDAGLAAEGPVWRALGYRLALDGFAMPGLRGDRAVEWAALVTARPRPGLRVEAGLQWSWAEFPYGSRLSVPLPLADVVWTFGP